MSLEIDFETRSDVDLKTRGAYLYFASPHARAMIASYTFGDGVIRRWRWPEPCPDDIRAHIEAGGTISAHNAAFERLCLNMLAEREGWPRARVEQFRCTAATAASLALPRDLDGLGAALGLTTRKDKIGAQLIRRFSIPRRLRAGETAPQFNEPEDFREEFDQFASYCDQDVKAEAAADRRMVPLSAEDQRLYTLDQIINDRGIRVDIKSARAALAIAQAAKTALSAEMRDITNNRVKSCENVARLAEWVREQGVEMASAQKDEIAELLELDDLPANVRMALELRQEAAKTSVSKLAAFLRRAGADGRIRGAFLFRAASTGRWSSVGAQVHNLPRPRPEYGDAKLDTIELFDTIRTGDPDALRRRYGPKLGRPLHLIADAIRGFLWAAPGHDLLVADYSGIEGAVAAWQAGEEWKVRAMHELIADPLLPDLYRRAAAGIYDTTPDDIPKKDPRRQVGKVAELSLQYQGGVGAFRSMARNYGLKLESIYDPVWSSADEERRERAERRYAGCVQRGDATALALSREAWIAAEIVKVGWRRTHPRIVKAWELLEDAARDAVAAPGVQHDAVGVTYLSAKGFLWCRLPSGRCLAYGGPKLKERVWARRPGADSAETMDRAEAEAAEMRGEVVIEGAAKRAVTALAVNSVTKKWERFGLYGGLAFENVVQAVACDLLANGITKAEGAGYPVIGHVHDEIMTEVPRGFGDVAAFERLICDLPPWAAGLPLTASGWRGKRYRKD